VELRSFYWDAADSAPAPRRWGLRGRRAAGRFRVGNAGDIFNLELAQHLYGAQLRNLPEEGSRLLLVGSVAHRILDGDIVMGIGTKGAPIPAGRRVSIRAVRGPITLEAYRDAGYDVSGVQFQLDPGLLVPRIYADELTTPAERGRVIFIPHYRDRGSVRSSRHYDVVDVDSTPRDLVRQILRAEFVYTSSLHGLVFAHALGRPAVLVAALNGEQPLKYQDYLASIGVPWVDPLSIEQAVRAGKPTSPVDVSARLDEFVFPSADELLREGILS
jgi:hypothetical protein